MVKYIIIVILLFIAFAIASADNPSPMGILKKKCYTCHNINIVLKAKKTADEWEATLDRMIDYGATIDSDERKILVEFLKGR
jgi:vacuolar-type H+-ATPase subunit C/Vma6